MKKENSLKNKYLEELVKILDPSNTKLHKLIAQVPMSRQTTERHIGAISKNVANNLICDLQNCTAFSLVLNKSRDIQNVPQLAILICYVHPDINVKYKELRL